MITAKRTLIYLFYEIEKQIKGKVNEIGLEITFKFF